MDHGLSNLVVHGWTFGERSWDRLGLWVQPAADAAEVVVMRGWDESCYSWRPIEWIQCNRASSFTAGTATPPHPTDRWHPASLHEFTYLKTASAVRRPPFMHVEMCNDVETITYLEMRRITEL